MKRIVFAAAGVLALVATACGGGDDHESMNMEEGSTATSAGGAVTAKTVSVTMIDIAYEPKSLTVQRGERVEFVFHNQGKIAHDAFIGDPAAQAEHEKEMTESSGGMGHTGGDSNAITVDPGNTDTLTHTFDKAGTLEIGCHQPGHYGAGMKIAVTVT